ncbi:hypothetical protein Q5H93_06610 [Hymenobacter sp. ASUV-10]|uniref:TFIIB-type zinc ribbon-containing protein n=1 Tax=Hymenobacter aranciens TaxID=3063996 RepID=A0ABT9B867_9BACT|nr:hypothetical protein [Hymenobacter sp. ASUV-10]MDO7874398.1 hypothetical protein [Hymenobacter sp. ASUV-10]
MAKALKVIQCPKCGSTQKTELRPDTFRCDSCGTEYFLDSDDLNVNIRHLPGPPPAPGPFAIPPAELRRRVRWAIVLGGLALVGSVVWSLLQRQQRRTDLAELQVDPIMTGRIDPEQPSWRSSEEQLVPGPGGQPVLVVAGSRGSFRDGTYTPTVGLYDARTGAAQQLLELPGGSGDLKLQRLSNGTLYVFQNNAVYQLDLAPPGLRDITRRLLSGQPALASGAATISPGTNDDDALRIFTNDGHTLALYPLIRRTYTDDERWDAAHGLATLRPGAPTRPAFAFSEPSMSYPEDPIQLIYYTYRDNGGGPKDAPRFSWDDDYGGSGIFTDADPHVKRLITPQELAKGRVLAFRDFTPGRRYFYPQLLCFDADYVLLTCHATAAPDSPVLLQALDARTAAIRFTTPLPAGAFIPNQALRTTGGFVLARDRSTATLSPTGELGPAVTIR